MTIRRGKHLSRIRRKREGTSQPHQPSIIVVSADIEDPLTRRYLPALEVPLLRAWEDGYLVHSNLNVVAYHVVLHIVPRTPQLAVLVFEHSVHWRYGSRAERLSLAV